MSYTIDRVFKDVGFDEIDVRARNALKNMGFGVLTQIDVKDTLKHKIGVDIAPYRILGACNPNMAHQALEIEPRVGAMLPCNLIIREVGDSVEVSVIDPVASMTAIDNDALRSVAEQVRDMLAKVVATI